MIMKKEYRKSLFILIIGYLLLTLNTGLSILYLLEENYIALVFFMFSLVLILFGIVITFKELERIKNIQLLSNKLDEFSALIEKRKELINQLEKQIKNEERNDN